MRKLRSCIEALSCGILQATQQTLDYIDKRADAIRSQADKVLAREYMAVASEALEDQENCPVKQLSPTGYDQIKEGLARERAAEADTLNLISQTLAEASMSAVTRLRDRAEVIRRRELTSRQKYLDSLDGKLVDKISTGIVNALLAGPASHLTSAQAVDEKSRTLELFGDIFGIPTEEDQDALTPVMEPPRSRDEQLASATV